MRLLHKRAEIAPEDALPSTSGSTIREQIAVEALIGRKGKLLSPRVVAAFVACSVISVAVALGAIGPPSITSFIIRDIGGARDAAWIPNAANVAQAAAGPPLAYLTDIYGRKPTTLICLAFGVAGSFISSRASSSGQVIAGQALNGIALAIIPLAYAIASEIVPHRYRGAAQFFLAHFASLGCIIGTLCGPAFISSDATDGWRDLFYLLGGLFSLSFIGVLFGYLPSSRQVIFGTQQRRIRDLDFIGYALLVSGLVLFLAGLTFGGSVYAWSSGVVLGLMIPGLVLLGACGIYEWRGTSSGLFDHRLFRERNFSLALAAIFGEAFLLFAFVALFAQEVFQLYAPKPIQQGLHTVGFWITGLVVSIPFTFLAHSFHDPRWPICVGFLGYIIAAIMLANATLSSNALVIVADCIGGAAYIAPLTFAIAVAQFCAPPMLIGTASALASTARALGASLSTAVFTAIYTNTLNNKLPSELGSAAASLGLPVDSTLADGALALQAGSSAPFLSLQGVTQSQADVLFSATRQAALDSYRWVWIAACISGAIAIAVTMFMQDISNHLTLSIDAPMKISNEPPTVVSSVEKNEDRL